MIDIGSNSVRLIVYQINGRSMVPRINEKVMAGLGDGLSETGRLSPSGVEAALKALSRYTAICSSLGITNVVAIATAATRDAADGAEFCDRIEERCGIRVRVLSGEEEAKFAAFGVVSAEREATGLIGDLGGSSLELVVAEQGQLAMGKTYKLGPLALRALEDQSSDAVDSHIGAVLTAQGDIPPAERFYAVGGAWRAIASVHMEMKNYPLRVLQSYTIPAEEVIELCDLICDLKKRPDSLLKSSAGKRYPTLHYTAMTLKKVMQLSGAREMLTSAYGLREGIVFDGMDAETRKVDPLFAGVAILARSNQRQEAFSRGLHSFSSEVLTSLSPVFGNDLMFETRLHEAAFILADMAAIMHPDHRSAIAREIVLRGPYTGVGHLGRIYLGLITGFRYNRKYEMEELEKKVLTSEQIDRAKTVALLMRVAAEFSGRTDRILKRAKLSVGDGKLILTVQSRHKDLVSEGVEKRLGHLASHMGLKAEIVT